ncbi:unnamed protein product [Cylindrotheca closterium]|uniref:Alpha N-terminal protein methyltransferase 1 n=1 Tax=Cylindrotheca closterium TaxID=2856 RepID=A0AAD2JPD7_9STRA|nr:unnamed protein product [Cylindrotheca closterium]
MTRKGKKKTLSIEPASAGVDEGYHSSLSSCNVRKSAKERSSHQICPESIKGIDDMGQFYSCHDELLSFQKVNQEEMYKANSLYWANEGCNGSTNEQAMVGDEGGQEDAEEGLAFLDRFLALETTNQDKAMKQPSCSHQNNRRRQRRRFDHAVDLGAGVGRLTKLLLLKRYGEVRLVEADGGWSKRSRNYLGRKRSSRCSFSHQRLDTLTKADVQGWGEPADLMWVQWTLQYLIDTDVVDCLKVLAGGLREGSGVLIVKENRPYGTQREDRFQMDMPQGGNERYDITRTDNHHRLLFHQAGLKVCYTERGEETNVYALTVM